MKTTITTYRSVPWLILSFALISSIAVVTVGIIILAMWNKTADIPLGILTIVFGVWGMSGSIATFILSLKQKNANLKHAKLISQLSHELKTPLTSIKIYIETLEMRRYKNETDHLLLFEQLHDEIYRIEKLISKTIGQQPKHKHLNYEIQPEIQLRKILAPFFQCTEYMTRLNFEAQPALPAINVNADDLNRTISNLVQNALTQNAQANVHVSASTDDENRLLIRIRNDASDIDIKNVNRLLESYSEDVSILDNNIENKTYNPIPGLALAAQFARDNDITLRVTDDANNTQKPVGAIVELTFPHSRLIQHA